jgi:hypothetical protein
MRQKLTIRRFLYYCLTEVLSRLIIHWTASTTGSWWNQLGVVAASHYHSCECGLRIENCVGVPCKLNVVCCYIVLQGVFPSWHRLIGRCCSLWELVLIFVRVNHWCATSSSMQAGIYYSRTAGSVNGLVSSGMLQHNCSQLRGQLNCFSILCHITLI